MLVYRYLECLRKRWSKHTPFTFHIFRFPLGAFPYFSLRKYFILTHVYAGQQLIHVLLNVMRQGKIIGHTLLQLNSCLVILNILFCDRYKDSKLNMSGENSGKHRCVSKFRQVKFCLIFYVSGLIISLFCLNSQKNDY